MMNLSIAVVSLGLVLGQTGPLPQGRAARGTVDPQAAPQRDGTSNSPGKAEGAPPSSQPKRALHEPEGRHILHFVGVPITRGDSADEYPTALAPSCVPIGESLWIDVPGTRDWAKIRSRVTTTLERLQKSGSMLNLAIGFTNGPVDGFSTAQDAEYATTTHYDALVDDLAKIVGESSVPTLLRIGVEVNGDWQGHHPFVFPLAFRKMVGQFRARGVQNVAFVWCVEGHGDPDIFGKDSFGNDRWFPGEDVIDWYSLDVFGVETFHPKNKTPSGVREPTFRAVNRAQRAPGGRKKAADLIGVTTKLLARAREVGKPVFIGETTCFPHLVPDQTEDPSGDGARKIWSEWFVPFLAFLDEHPEIKAVDFCPMDWVKTPIFADWGDARIQISPTLVGLWREELKRERWINLAPPREGGARN